MQRTSLVNLVIGLFSALIIAFLLILFSSLNAPIENSEVHKAANAFADLAAGETGKRRFQGRSVWVTHLSNQQRLALREFTPQVVHEGGCEVEKFCVLVAATARDGIEISYTFQRPPQVPRELPWNGGFVNPLNGAVYDLLGRAYKLNSGEHKYALPSIALSTHLENATP